MHKKVKVMVFPWSGSCKVKSCEGMENSEEQTCNCGGSCAIPGFGPRLFCAPFKGESFDEYDPGADLFSLIDQLKTKFANSVEVEIAEYTEPQKVYHTIDQLNQLLYKSGEKFLVTTENVFIFVSHATPIIAINDIIEFAGEVPDSDRFFKRINKALLHQKTERR